MQQDSDSSGSADRPHRGRALMAAPLVAIVIMTAACSGGGSTADSAGSSAASDETPGSLSFDDTLSPLIVSTTAGDPIPVRGSDDQFHVAYELSVLNYAPYPAVITSLTTVSPDGAVVTSLSQEQVQTLSMIVPELSIDGAPATGIPPGATGLLVLEDVYPDRASVPDSVTHRISASFNPLDGIPDPRAGLWPSDVTQTVGPMAISPDDPVVLGAPLAGDGWLAGNGCCDDLNFHRNVLFPIGGAINGGERFAIDFTGVKRDMPIGAELTAGIELITGTDGTANQDYLAYGAPVLAVADATVVKVVSDVPDTAPGGRPTGEGLSLNTLGGNVVVLRLAPDLFAFYLHLAPDSITVQVGDEVTKGQVVAQLGNSGNSSEAHLHFQLGTTPQAFSARNVPYVFEDFVVNGTLTTAGLRPEPGPGPRRDELPLALNVIDFPAAP